MSIFMVLYYRLPGILSVFSLIYFTLFSLAMFVLIPVTLTLPGIAGFVLSIATAVDANILVFERFKEELRGGRTLRAAVEAAFSRAWPSIRDSNIGTLIVCAILFFFGNTFRASAVKGFAITLIIGILCSLFTVMFVSRTLMRLAFMVQSKVRTCWIRRRRSWESSYLQLAIGCNANCSSQFANRNMFNIFKIIKNRRIYFIISILVILPGLAAMIYNVITLPTHAPWKFSPDFLAGNRFELKFNQPITEDQIRATFQKLNFPTRPLPGWEPLKKILAGAHTLYRRPASPAGS